jgi:aspartate kinase
VRGATLSRKLARVFLKGVPNEPGMAARIFAHIGRHNVVVDDIIQVSQPEAEKADLGFTVNADEAAEAKIVCEDIAKELGFDAVEVDNDVAKVSVVGIGMRTHTGVAAKMFGALADGGISIEDITTSEIVIGCLIRRADADRALQLVHKAFALDQEPDAA